MAIKPIMTSTSASFTRPSNTTTYAADELVANSATAGSVSPLSFLISVGYGRGLIIKAAKLEKSTTTTANSAMTLFLYASSPTVTNGDNAAFLSTESTFVGTLALATCSAFFSDGASSYNSYNEDNDIHWRLASGSYLYGLLKVTGAYAPGSAETFEVTLVLEHY